MADADSAPYRDPSLSVEERVEDLLGRLTLAEKVAQLGGLAPSVLFDDGAFDRDHAADHLEGGIVDADPVHVRQQALGRVWTSNESTQSSSGPFTH